MSEYWFLYCRTCQTDEGRVGSMNHGVDRGLREIIKALPALAELQRVRDMMQIADLQVTLLGGEDCGAGLLDFALKHATHDVTCRSEYGTFDDRCGERFTCHCQRWLSCELPKGHEGTHQQERDSVWAKSIAEELVALIDARRASHRLHTVAASEIEQILLRVRS